MIRLDYKTGLKVTEPTAVTIGKFDGIHRGHELLAGMIREKRKQGLKSLIVTFSMTPRVLFSDEAEQAKTLITSEERAFLLEQEGIDYLLEMPLTDEVMHMSPEEFLKLLCEDFQMQYLCVGEDFHFGYQGRGDAALLEANQKQFGYILDVVKKLKKEQRDISSTYIRPI